MRVRELDEALQRRLYKLYRVIAGVMLCGLVTHIVFQLTGNVMIEDRLFLAVVFVSCTAWTLGLTFSVRPSVLRARRTLLAIDASTCLIVGVVFAALIPTLGSRTHEVYFLTFLAGMTALTRALLVPTPLRYTAWLIGTTMGVVFASNAYVAFAQPARTGMTPVEFIVNAAFMCFWPVVTAVAGAWQLTRLRDQIDAARTLGSYTLGDKIGEGGMGSVFKARHSLLRRPTAIKILPAERGSDEAIKRFEREVQLTAELTDPHVVSVFDYGRGEDGTFYYAMEYLDGIDLETLVREHGAQPAPRVIHILRQACDALAEAHGRGLIHRDVKPANIVLCERGATRDFVKVLDFGLVKQTTEIADIDQSANEHVVAGTPLYMAPEALREPSSIGPAADLYALGGVAYYLLTGKRLFDAKTFPELCVAHLTQAPTPPSQRCGHAIPADLEALVLACLEKVPQARPASAADLAGKLDAIALSFETWNETWNDDIRNAWWAAFRQGPSNRSKKLVEDAPTATAIDPHAHTMAIDLRGRTAPDYSPDQ